MCIAPRSSPPSQQPTASCRSTNSGSPARPPRHLSAPGRPRAQRATARAMTRSPGCWAPGRRYGRPESPRTRWFCGPAAQSPRAPRGPWALRGKWLVKHSAALVVGRACAGGQGSSWRAHPPLRRKPLCPTRRHPAVNPNHSAPSGYSSSCHSRSWWSVWGGRFCWGAIAPHKGKGPERISNGVRGHQQRNCACPAARTTATVHTSKRHHSL